MRTLPLVFGLVVSVGISAALWLNVGQAESRAQAIEPPPASEASPTPSADRDAVERIASTLEKLAGARPDLIKPTPVAGVYLVLYGSDVLFVSADAKYLFRGDMRELPSMRSVSDKVLTEMRKPLMQELAALESIDFPAKGEVKHTITVFTDIDCTYCVKLHRGMQRMNELGISVRYVAYPRAGLMSPSYNKWVDVWCADDRRKALTAAKAGELLESRSCDNPVRDHMSLAGRLGVSGTPAILTEGGRLIPGYMPPEQLLVELNGG